MPFLKDSAKMIVLRGVALCVGAITAVVLARWLGPADRGTLAVWILSVSLAGVVLALGIPESLIYFIGARTYPKQHVATTAFAYCAAVSVALGIPAFLILGPAFDFEATVAGLLVAATATSLTLSTARHVLLGEKRFAAYSLSTVLERALYFLAVVILRQTEALSVTTALAAYALSSAATSTLLFGLLRASGALVCSFGVVHIGILRSCIQRGFHLFMVGLGGFAVQRINYFALEVVSGARVVGLFTAANTVPRLVANLPQQLAITLYAYVSNRVTPEEGASITTAISSSLTLVFAIMLVPLAFFAEPLAILLFDQEFAGIGRAMTVLTASMMCGGLSSLLFNSLAGAGRHEFGSKMTFLNLAALCVFSVLLIPRYGLIGAAWAQLFSNLVNLAYIAIIFCRISEVPLRSLAIPSPSTIRALVGGIRRPKAGAKARE